jgi:hypothetical protein
LHPNGLVTDERPSEDRMAALMRRLDDLLDEAAQLRAEVANAVRARVNRPFWPDRRRVNVPHEPDRRAR